MPLWLIGMMGSGKSAVGQALADRTGKPFLDTDLLVTAKAGCSVLEVFTAEGEAGFRQRETEAVQSAARAGDAVVATGGGVVLSDDNVRSMKASGVVVWLQAEPVSLAARLGQRSDRPLLDGADDPEARLKVILEQRRRAYELAADYVVPTDGATLEEVTELVGNIWIAS